jgi:hypothetical protein
MSANTKHVGQEYNGWANYETWNVSLWINNTENLYKGAVEFMQENPDPKNPYKAFVISCGLSDQLTADGVPYMTQRLNYDELNDMMKELVE